MHEVTAQPATSDHSAFSFDHLTVDDGLSYSTVHDILEDKLGMIWIGTRFGLNRFDGYDFKVYLPDPKDPYAIKSQSILSLFEDHHGDIWIGHLNGGVSILQRSSGRFLRFPFATDTTVDWNTITVRALYRDPAGNMWLGTYGAGTFVFDSTHARIAHFCTSCTPDNRRLTNDFVFDFVADPEGHIWIGTAGRGITYYDPAGDKLHTIHGDDAADMDGFSKSLSLGQDNAIWLGTEGNGLYKIDLDQGKVTGHYTVVPRGENGLSNPMITDLLPDRDGYIWIATDGGGINRFNPATGMWQHFNYQPDFLSSLNSDAIYDLMFDRAGNLWVGTFNGGINVHKAVFPPFVIDRQYAKENAAGLRSVLCVAQQNDSIVYLGTDGGGLLKLNVKTKPLQLTSADLHAAYAPGVSVITSMAFMPDGELWLGTFARGLFRYSETKGVIAHYTHDPTDPSSISHNNVWDLEPDDRGGLWIATLGGGVCYFDTAKHAFTRYVPEPGNINSLSGTQIIDVCLDKRRNCLWAASENAGLSRIDLSTTIPVITQFHADEKDSLGLSSEKLRCLFQDKAGTLWIGTENAGLSSLPIAGRHFTNYSNADGLPSNMINSIVQGKDGSLWIATQAGIVRWDVATDRFLKIGTEPFLKNNQYNPRAALRLADGRLLLGSTNGYSILLPNQVREDTKAPVVIFTGLNLLNEDIPIGPYKGRNIISGPLNDPGTLIRLSYQDKGIRIDFTTSDLVQADKNLFAYRLIGFDTAWRYVGPDQRFATYSALPGGRYELQVKAANSAGMWSALPSTLILQVTPPFWKTWWFIAVSTLLIIGMVMTTVVFLLNRQKTHYQQKALEAGQEILRLQNESLEKDIVNKQAQLSASVLQSAHKNQFLEDLKAEIHRIEHGDPGLKIKELHRLSRSIDNELTQKDYWDQFQLTFNQVHQDFVHNLQAHHPHISSTESRLCCFIRMGFSNAEIASILNITVNGVEQSKYRLKKKLGLERDALLNEYILQL